MLGTAEVLSGAGDKPGGCNKGTLGTTCVGRCSVGGEAQVAPLHIDSWLVIKVAF